MRLEGGGGVGVAVDSRRRFAGGPSELLGLPNKLSSSWGDSTRTVVVRSKWVLIGLGAGILSPN